MKVKIIQQDKDYQTKEEIIRESDYIQLEWDLVTLVSSLGFEEIALEYPYKVFITK